MNVLQIITNCSLKSGFMINVTTSRQKMVGVIWKNCVLTILHIYALNG